MINKEKLTKCLKKDAVSSVTSSWISLNNSDVLKVF